MTTGDAEHEVGPEEPSLWDTVKGDFASAAGRKLVLVVLLILWMGFQWGPGNDIILAPLAATVFDTVDDTSSWGIGVLAVGAAAVVSTLFWAATQALDAVVVLSGIKLVPGVMERLGRSLRRRGLVTAYADMRWTTRWMLSYATGVSVLGLVDVLATGRAGVRGRRVMLAQSVMLSAGTVGLVVAAVATAPMIAARYPATADEADTFLRYARNPLVWLAIFGGVFLIDRLRDRRSGADG